MRLLRNVVGAVLYHQEDSKWTLCGVIRWGRGLHLLIGEVCAIPCNPILYGWIRWLLPARRNSLWTLR